MSIRVINRVFEHSQQRHSAKLLLVALARYADDNGICWPGVSVLAKNIGEDERYTRVLISKLVEAGELVRVAGGGRGKPSRYGIIVGLTLSERARVQDILSTDRNPVLEIRVSENTVLENTDLSDNLTENPVLEISDLSENPVLEIRVSQDESERNPDLFAKKTLIFSEEDKRRSGASGSAETAIAKNNNRQPIETSCHGDSNGNGMANQHARAREVQPPPLPDSSPVADELPEHLTTAASAWLNRQITQAERKRLLSLLADYGANWLEAGLNAATVQGGKSLKYLEVMLAGCRRDGRPPGSPRTNGATTNGATAHNTIRPLAQAGSRRPSAEVAAERLARYRKHHGFDERPAEVTELPDLPG